MLSIFLLFQYQNAESQNWIIFNPNYKYNYRYSSSDWVNCTIFSDSAQINGNDTIFYLNRIIKDWEDGPVENNISIYAHYNAPQFLMENIYVTDSSFNFENPWHFYIPKKPERGKEWLFDETKGISANYFKDSIYHLFGSSDSIRIIELSNGENIFLSKNFGIVRFGSIYEDKSYELLGIEELAGEQILDYRGIFDFQVGDVFERFESYDQVESYGTLIYTRTSILERTDYPDSINYLVLEQKNISTGLSSGLYTERLTANEIFLRYQKNNNPVVDGYNNQLIHKKEYGNFYDYHDYNISKLEVDRSFNGRVTKTVGFFDIDGSKYEIYNIQDTVENLLKRQLSGFEDETMQVFVQGLGEVLFENNGFEWGSKRELTAYKKGGINYGTFAEDDLYLGVERNKEADFLEIYPNPASQSIIISTDEGRNIKDLQIIDLNGRIIRYEGSNEIIDIFGLSDGVYFLRIEFEDFIAFRKFIKQ